MTKRGGAAFLTAGLACLFCCLVTIVGTAGWLNLLPTPEVIKIRNGQISPTPATGIVATDATFKPPAETLLQEIIIHN